MNVEEFREYCLNKAFVEEGMPFGESTLVFKVAGKIFALCGLDAPNLSVNLKCEPEQAIAYREQFSEIQPGYHMNKKHWNTVDFESDLPESFLKQMIDDSYHLVLKSLSQKKRNELKL